jgi:hypothetical protein
VPQDYFDKLNTTLEGISQRLSYTPPSQQAIEPEVQDVSEKEFAILKRKARETNDTLDWDRVDEAEAVRVRAAEERALRRSRSEFEGKFSAGVQAIDYLTTKVQGADKTYKDLLKKELDVEYAKIPAEQRMNPQVYDAVYELVAGRNTAKIVDYEKEMMMRKMNEGQPSGPGSGGSRREAEKEGERVPDAKDILPADALEAIRYKGVTVDEYYKSLGYKGGWKEHYKENKDFYIGTTE